MTVIPAKSNLFLMMTAVIVASFLLLTVDDVQAEKQSQKAKGLGEQVQNVKKDVLSIAKELDQLERKLLYPSHTQLAIFVSLRDHAKLRLDSVDIELDGKEVSHHLYTANEVEAFSMGGVQRIYTGNVSIGTHELKVTMRGKASSGDNVRIVKNFPIKKEVKAGIAELLLSENTITLINR